jgi:hypothetical protein
MKKTDSPDPKPDTLDRWTYSRTGLTMKGTDESCDMKGNMELNGFGGFACYSPESFSPSYINLMIFECDGLDSESPNRSPSVAKRLRCCKLEPSKPMIRESRKKKMSFTTSTPEIAVRITKTPSFSSRWIQNFDRYALLPINRRGRRHSETAITFTSPSLV